MGAVPAKSAALANPWPGHGEGAPLPQPVPAPHSLSEPLVLGISKLECTGRRELELLVLGISTLEHTGRRDAISW